MKSCPKCGGEMRSGEIFIQVTSSTGQNVSGLGMMQMPGMGIPRSEITREERAMWREKTGRKAGVIIKRDEERTLKIAGQRCTKCGYIEIFVQE